jgi:hypothetical protein
LNWFLRLVSKAGPLEIPGGVPRALLRYSPRVAKPSFQNVMLNDDSETLSPNHWCMFSWLNVPNEVPFVPPIDPPAKVILPCISSSKLAGGMPTTTPSVVSGHGPLKTRWNSRMSSWLSIAVLLIAFRAGAIALACAS